MGTRTYLYTVVQYRWHDPMKKKSDGSDFKVFDEFACGGQTCKKILNYINTSYNNTWFRKLAKKAYDIQKKIVPMNKNATLLVVIDTYLIRKSRAGYIHRILSCWTYQYIANDNVLYCFPTNFEEVFDHAFNLHNNPQVKEKLDFSKCALQNDVYVYRNVTAMYADFYDRKISATSIGARLESALTKMGSNEITAEYQTIEANCKSDPTRTFDMLSSIIDAYRAMNENTEEHLQKIIEEVGDHFDWRDGYVE